MPRITKIEEPPLTHLNRDPTGVAKQHVQSIGQHGLFVTREYGKYEFIINYRGIHCVEANPGPFVYWYRFNGTRYIDASDETTSGLGRFINDIDPFVVANCEAKVFRYQEKGINLSSIYFRAIRHIAIGTFDLHVLPFPCSYPTIEYKYRVYQY